MYYLLTKKLTYNSVHCGFLTLCNLSNLLPTVPQTLDDSNNSFINIINLLILGGP